jgi:AraC family transcriptional regulator, regulatory protein of adaptative response / DNA-3-methyladenine glycosylase II
MRFYPTAAAAQQAGFRACLRCRPDATPGSPEWNMRADVVARAMRLIRDGIVDREGVEGLAVRLGYSVRQLNRLITAEVGTGPLALARAQRSQTARILLETTDLPVAHVAFAAGFASVRQCNETVREIFAETPTGLRTRARRAVHARRPPGGGAPQSIHLRLPCRQPFNPASVLEFLGLRALPGIEDLADATYRRSLRLPHGHGIVTLAAPEPTGTAGGGRSAAGSGSTAPGPAYVEADLVLSDLRDLTTAVARCRQLLDLDTDPVAIADALGRDSRLGPAVTRDPGRRVPGAVDGFELAVRAVIGQQVSVPGARTVAGRLVHAAGDPLPAPDGGITHLFPTPGALLELARRDPGAFAMPAGRRRALEALSEAVQCGGVVIDPGADPGELRESIMRLPGIGPWTAEYVAMRALRDPDAFMPTDLGIRRGAALIGLPGDQPAALTDAGEAWRPWRSYAMAHLWAMCAPIAPARTDRVERAPTPATTSSGSARATPPGTKTTRAKRTQTNAAQTKAAQTKAAQTKATQTKATQTKGHAA